ncbi:MAG: DNA-binding protein [Sulfurimonas sp.]|nr:DNA-binding protein [Sulfurimonas sp.]
MKKLNVAEAAEYFGVSKEAIHNRIRRGSLEAVVENGIKMVLINPATPIKQTRKATPIQVASSNDERYYKLLKEQNEKLQFKVEKLEGETRALRDQKELMLIKEREKIEAIYKEKDEQLKNFLSTLSAQFALTAPKEEMLEAEIEEESVEELTAPPISLNKFLKSTKFSDKKKEKIKVRFKKRAKKDERIISIGGKLYLSPSKYSYSDLL